MRLGPTTAVLLTLLLGACATAGTGEDEGEEDAEARVVDAQGRHLGTLELQQTGETTRVTGTLQNVPPGTHALHVHEVGVCEPPFTSAGGHFNPDSVPHGRATPQGGHAGDLPNVEASAAGTVTVDATVRAPLEGTRGMLDADGAAIVLHAQADDERTDPSGNAGDRIACGVIDE